MSDIAWTAFCLARSEGEGMLFVGDDDQQAEAVAAALRALRPDATVVHLPASDALPGDVAPASPANVGARVSALRTLHLAQGGEGSSPLFCLMSGEAAARLYAPSDAFGAAPPSLRVGDPIDVQSFAAALDEIGYFADDRVDEPGEMAVRGEVIDIYPADAGGPVRIEIADAMIASIRRYDPVTQRSAVELDRIEIGRASEPTAGRTATILDHMRPGRMLLSAKADKRRLRFRKLAVDAARGPAAVVDAVDEDSWRAALAQWRVDPLEDPGNRVPRFAETRSPLAAFGRYVKPLLAAGKRFVLAGSERDVRFLRSRVAKRLGIELPPLQDAYAMNSIKPGQGGATLMPADAGFVCDDLIFVAAADILGSRALVGDLPASVATPWAVGGADVRVGDVVVHEDHGVGMIAGLEAGSAGDSGADERIVITYAGGARRLVRHDEADRVWRYGADADAVTLDKLDGSSWRKRRAAIDAAIAQSAKGLAALAEARAKLVAPVIDPDQAAYERFAGGFPFNETADQARAIAAVRDDLARGRPMDRLIVGDVGYGKTEIALRAAALAALAGFQVIVAAPTTVLVRQHLETFARRFEGTGIAVAGLSRLSSAAEKKATKAGLADGSIGIVIGTAAVMAKGVAYARLGLVIIDEEQRFGAADKAKLRGSGEVHLLTLSATPIPRTLQMALVGLQQISVIATPPARRQPIRTSLDQYDDGRIRTALLREKGRGGQSFIVVPRIEDMAGMSEKIRRIVPDFRLVEAHGKMAAADIDAVMVGFAQGEGDVLLATNIIEAGLDVPRANTMIVGRADRFGLAQLHQLRGRVGRGNRRGQVILLTQTSDAIGDRTMKRLRTLATFDRLGAGFDISAQDLDMRGAGDLLGDAQAGHMKLIGVDLYQHLLEAALRVARGETVERWTPELHLGETGRLPDDWIPEEDVRLSLYVRLSRIVDEAGLDRFEEELIDRFGPLPTAAERLIACARLRMSARTAGIARIDAGLAAIALTPRKEFVGDPSACGLTAKEGRLLLKEAVAPEARTERIGVLLDALTP